jgi:MFS family permease
VGTGLTYPLTAIYLAYERGLGTAGPSVWFGITAAAGLVMTIPTGMVAAHWGPRWTATAGAALQAVGYVILAFAGTLATVAAAAMLVGTGTTLFFVTFVLVLADLTEESQRRRCYAARYAVQNIGLGAGAVFGGIAVADGFGHFAWLSVVNGSSYLVLAIAIVTLAPRGRTEPEHTGVRASWRVLRAPTLRVLLIINAAFVICGAAQLEGSIPVLLHEKMNMSSTVLGLVLATNTAAVVVLQPFVVRITRRMTEMSILNAVFGAWTVAFVIGAFATFAPAGIAVALLLCFAVWISIGECLYATSYYPLLAASAPPSSAVQWSAWSSFSWCSAFSVAPLLGLQLIGAVPAFLSWVVFAVVSLTFVLVIAFLRVTRKVGLPAGDQKQSTPTGDELASAELGDA